MDERIVQAALTVIAREGYAQASFETIAREARVGRPAIYRRYSSKNELAIRCLAEVAVDPNRPQRSRRTEVLLLADDRIGWLGDVLAVRDPESTLLRLYRDQVLQPLIDAARSGRRVNADSDDGLQEVGVGLVRAILRRAGR